MPTQRMTNPVLSLIVPVYNESETIDTFFEKTEAVLSRLDQNGDLADYEIICVNDGSMDNTVSIITNHHERNPRIKLLDLSRNFGKEAALTAGMSYATGDVIVPIDADLEEPPELIAEFLTYWHEGYDMVYGARASREFDSFAKQFTSRLFYRFFNIISEHPIPSDAGDFRLMDRAVVDIINAMPERNRFMKGIFSWPGFKTKAVPFHRQSRHAGATKFSPVKLMGLAFSGIVSFSLAPIRMFVYLGVMISIFAFCYMIFTVFKTLFFGIDEPGYASLMSVGLFLGGIQVLGLGIIGEYVGRIYIEVKNRPIYVIQQRLGFERERTAESPPQ